MLCYSLAKHARFFPRYIVSPNMRDFASLGLWSFPNAIYYFFVGEVVENIWEKTDGVLVS